MQWLMIGVGAGFGAILRAWLARLNPLHAWLPFGTLSANILGGLLMGVVLAVADRLSPQIRGLVMTGFLGGLTTFSTFSGEVFGLLQAGKVWQGLALVGLHVVLTLMATAVGFYVIKL